MPNIVAMSLLTEPVLVMDQVTNMTSNDFAIFNATGTQVGHVSTGGGTLQRMFMGSRELTVYDGPDNPLLQVQDTVTFGRERMSVLDGNGHVLAELVKRFTFLTTKVDVTLQGEPLQLTGNMFDFDFELTSPHGSIARVTREWSGLGKALLGHSRYVVQFAEAAGPHHRQAGLGCVLALDLIREKARSSS